MKRWIVFAVLVPILVVVFWYSSVSKVSEETKVLDLYTSVSTELHPASYSQPTFYEGIEQPDYVDKIPEQIRGGIVSHHLLAKEEIAKFFAEFRSQTVETVVLIAPNHFSIGDAPVITSEVGFTTPYGDVAVDRDVVQKLAHKKVVAVDEKPFAYEHSIGALTPYIAYNFPGAKIVPLLLRRNTSREQLDDLLTVMQPLLPDHTIVIASVDFSHHLNRIATEFHDFASVSAIKNFDFDRVFKLEIDSPPSIYLLLQYLDRIGAKSMQYRNVNSTDFTGNVATNDATSYVFAHFINGDKDVKATKATSLHFGDMMFGREIESMIEHGNDPFEYIKGTEGNFMKGVDVTIGNLEGVLSSSTNCRTDKEVIFKFKPSVGALLRKYNFSGVNLANNHSNDCFESGLSDTQRVLEANDLFYLGSELQDGYKVITVGSESIALIGINDVTRWKDNIEDTLSQIRKLSVENDSVVLHIHWGREYDSAPTNEQQILAHRLVDAGAQVIIGHQPHVIQNVEFYKGKMIFYSLGNFIFDQTQPGTTDGFAVGLVHDEGVIRGVIFPYKMNDMRPKLLPYEEMVRYCDVVLSGVDRVDECGFKLNN